MNNSPTIVAASLNDDKLKASIEQMVQNLNAGLEKMKENTDSAVEYMQKSLQKLGDTKIDSGGSADGGASRRAKAQNEETDAVQKTTAARKEYNATLDQTAQAMQKAAGGSKMSVIETYDMQIELLKNRLREVRQDIDIFNTAIGSGKKTQVEWGQQGLKQAREEAELLMKQITALESKRGGLQRILEPQGDTIKNFVQSLQKANPELALLNQQYKEGNALLQQKNTTLRRSADEEQRIAKESRERIQSELAYAATASQREQQRQQELRRTGQTAREASRSLIESMAAGKDDLSTANYEKLVSYMNQMKQVYYNFMSDQERESPVGRALKNDIEIVEKATLALRKYGNASSQISKATNAENSPQAQSLETLRAKLKELTDQYSKLTVAEINAGKDNGIIDKYQRISRAAEILQKNLSTPISFSAVNNIQVRTLDDMAYKLRQLQAYKQSIDLTRPDADRKIREVDAAIVQLKKDMDKYMSTGREVNSMNNALGRSWNYMKNRLAFYFTVGASTAFVKNLINIRGQYELLERSIGILFDSMQTGTKIFSELNAMAIKSPFTTMELGAAAKQLSAYNIAAKDVVDTTRRLADIAAAVGVPIERLTYALGQIKSYGYLNSRDARMFANAGIPLIQNLADMYTKLEGRLVSIGDVYDRIKHKQVSFEDTLKVVNEMTDEGGRFFNFQEKAADTLVVRLANLTLAWNNMMNELGKDNTGMIHGMLGGLKAVFEHWRDIDAAIWGVIKILGLLKGAQLAWLLLVKRTGIELALMQTLGAKLADTIRNIALGMRALAANPMTWIAAAVVALGYLYQKWDDLQEANEAFNKSISDNAKENVDSINKFFDKYRKEIESIGSASSTDQEKMWERIRDEIEKTTKNAQQYIDILEKIPDTAERVGKAKEFLEQQQVLQQEAKRMADHGMFDMGGGFANDTLAKDLQEYEKTMNSVLKKYNSLEEAQKDFDDSMIAWSEGHYAVKYYNEAVEEAEKELDDFTSILDKANLARVMGEGSDEERLANIRSFAQLIRDNFLATEEGQKISAEGQARLNKEIDYWIAQQGVSNGLIKEQRADVEANRSAWETFFTYLNADQKKALDYLISTGQTSSDEFKKIWNGAADEMKKSSLTAYEQIQEHIADLRKTAPIVINVVYRETKESKDEAQKDFEKRFTTPDYVKNRSAEAYLAEQKRLNTIYGRFNKKTDEDMVEWEKRLGQEYQDNEKKLSDYNKMLEGYNKLSDEQKKKREAQINTVTKERDALQATQNALKEIQSYENFDFEQFKKGKKSGGSKKDFLGEAFAKVVEITTNMQKRFKEYKQAGVDANTALEKSTQEYAKTLDGANSTLAKYGIKNTKTGLELAKMELRDLRTYYESLLAIASGVGNTKGVEALEKAIASLNVEITNIDYKKITDGLNNELSKLKDEYELAVDLDANPELGDVFADMMGISKEQLAELPRDFEGVVRKMQQTIDQELGAGKFDIRANLNKSVLEEWAKSQSVGTDSELYKKLEAYVDYANKVRQDDTKKQIDEWNNLLEKYAEYEYKVTQIQKEAEREREVARKKGASQEIIDAITERERQELAKLSFEEFQKNPIWTTAIGDLEGMTHRALRLLINDLEDLKKANKDLSPKQIKEIERTITKLRKQSRKDNPFYILANAISDAKERADEFQPRINEIEKEIDRLTTGMDSSNLDENSRKIAELREELAKLKEIQDEEGGIDWEKFVEGINAALQVAKQATGYFTDMMDALGGEKGSLASKRITEIFGVLEKAGAGAAMGAQISGGSGYGAIIGAVVGGLSGAITTWNDEWSGNASITRAIESSVKAAKDLENTYKRLTYVAEDFYGASSIASKEAAKNVKILELAELQRQLRLEQSRDGKNRDQDRINDIRSQIIDLEHEVANSTKQTVSDLLGISSHADFFEGLISDMISAFKNGEDAMDVFENKWAEMIDSMVTKMILGQVLQQWIKSLESGAEGIVSKYTENYATQISGLESQIESIKSMGWVEFVKYIRDNEPELYKNFLSNYGFNENSDWQREILYAFAQGGDELREEYIKMLQKRVNGYTDAQQKASLDATEELIEYYENAGEEFKDKYLQAIVDKISENYVFGQDSQSKLSALQQGIQGVTEDTAGALEAMMNGMSQQIYLHTDLLMQIRDAIMGADSDLQIGVQGQILLQLQSSYQTQMAIQSILEGWSSANGMAVKVELVS